MNFLARLITGLALLGAIAAQAEEQSVAGMLAARYPKGSIASLDAANRALSEAEQARTRENAQLRAEEQTCHQKFFTTACIESARERHHFGLTQIRQVELEAKAFKRQARAAERDQAMQERLVGEADSKHTDDRAARHEAKLKRLEEEEAAKAPQRASNIAAYEKKQREAQERQEQVAKRLAEKGRQAPGKPGEK